MPRGRKSIYRSNETRSQLDMHHSAKPAVVGRLIDNNHMMAHIPDAEIDEIASVRKHLQKQIRTGKVSVTDAKLIAEILEIRWRDVGDGPIDSQDD